MPRSSLDPSYPPVPGQFSSCLRAFATLCKASNIIPFVPFAETRHCQAVISGNIVTDIYPVRRIPFAARKTKYAETERRLDQWFIGLPDQLRYDGTSRRAAIPPPHVLFLNIRYWAVVLLLNRALYVAWVNIYIY